MRLIGIVTFWIASFLYIAAPIEAARILAIIPIPSYSHQVPYQPIWTTLSQRGHQVVLLTTDPINDSSLTNLTEIDFKANYVKMQKMDFVRRIINGETWIQALRTQLADLGHSLSENIYQHHEVRKMYAPNSGEKFDVIIVEALLTPSLYALAHRFNAPLIGVTSLGLFSFNYYLNGGPILPSHPATWEMGASSASFNLPLWKRINNFIELWYSLYHTLNHFYPHQQMIAEKYLGKNIPDISDMERNISIVLCNQQEVLSFIRPTMANIISFGNLHVTKRAPVPKDLADFMADSPNGFIYMSLGTNVKISSFPNDLLNVFLDVFAKLPYKIVWKLDMKLTNKPDNIYIAQWFPQQSVLAHPNIRMFIYQGGLQSTEEALHYAVPLLGLPVLADQHTQVFKMVTLGVAHHLSLIRITREELNSSIHEIMNDKRYKERMLELKTLNEDKPYNLLDNAIWWIEFVIRHKDAPHLRTSIAHDPWYQKYDMDIIAILSIFIFVILLSALLIIYKFIKTLFFYYTKTLVDDKKKIN